MKRITKFLSILLCFMLVISTMSPTTAKAATKPVLWTTSASISLGTQSYAAIGLDDKVSGAKYTYTSSNTKIVTVNAKGVLTGVKYGTAKIAVKQILNKKTTTIGTCKITVKKSSIWNEDSGWLVIGKDVFTKDKTTLANWDLIEYAIPSATYTYYSNDTSCLVIKKDGTVVETKKAGKVSVTIKETYKKITRTVGKYTIDVKSPEMTVENNSKDIALGESFSIYDCYAYYADAFYVETKDNDDNDANDPLSFVKDESGNWTGDIKGVKEGTMTVSIYMGNEKTDTNLLGTFTVNVKTYPATDITLDQDSVSSDIQDSYEWFGFTVAPYNCTDIPVITSSDTSIVSINPDVSLDQYGEYKEFKVDLNKVGTATITIKVGTITKEIKLTVYDSLAE